MQECLLRLASESNLIYTYIMTIKEKLQHEKREIKKQVQKQLLTYIVASLGLIAGLAWNEAIKGLIEYIFPLSQNTIQAKFLYAIFMTILIVIISYYLARLMQEKDEEISL